MFEYDEDNPLFFIIRGLDILSKYCGGYDIGADHDVIYAGPYDISVIDDEDKKELEKLGWHIDSEADNTYAHFV